MKTGRPTKYKPEMIDKMIECGKQGMGVIETCVAIGIARDTWNQWQKLNPDFSDAIKRCKAESQAWWERKGREGTVGEIEGFQQSSYIFQMKNRFPDDWRDKRETEHSGGLNISVVDSYDEHSDT